MHHIFLDESGELGFAAGSSNYMLIALVATSEPKALKNAMRKEKKKLHDLGWPPSLEIKGTSLFGSSRKNEIPKAISDNRIDHLKRIIQKIINCGGVTPHYSIVRKDRLTQNLRNAPYGISYNYFSGCLLCKVHNGEMNVPTKLIVDRRNKETHAHMPFDGYIETRIISDCNHEHEFQIKHEDSSMWLGLQAVDFISWGLFRKYEHGDDTYERIIRPKVGICDSWYA